MERFPGVCLSGKIKKGRNILGFFKIEKWGVTFPIMHRAIFFFFCHSQKTQDFFHSSRMGVAGVSRSG